VLDTRPVFDFDMAYMTDALCLGVCGVTVITAESVVSEALVVVLTEDPRSGPSVDNVIEKICSQVRNDYLMPLHISAHSVRWYVYYPGRSWARVEFQDIREGSFTGPLWSFGRPQFDLDKIRSQAEAAG
jgi:hypothetical protein